VPDHWFEPIADHLGAAYLRYSFTKGTEQEVDFLVGHLGLTPGMRVLDVGCGPGRHAHSLARRGIEVVGIDISQRFIDLANESAPPGASFVRLDARALAFDAEFDVALSLCQGAFGLLRELGDTVKVLDGMARALRPGGRIAVSAFSAYFSVKYQVDADFDAVDGVAHERTEIRSEAGEVASTELWTTCFTPRELVLLAGRVGLVEPNVYSVEPGAYALTPPTVDSPEFLLVARRS
jgi:SAM-dependent methyltransferase